MFIEFHAAFLNASALSNMFTLDESVTWIEKIVRPMIVYGALVFMLRLFGKRELAQLNPLDLVVILSLSNTVQNAIIGPDNSLIGGVVGALSLLAINFIFSRLKYSSRSLEAATEGLPVTLIKDGKADERNLRRELITKRDIEIIAHRNGLDHADNIEKLVLDPSGTFLVDGKDEIRDAKFKREVLAKIDGLSKQLTELNAALQKG
jgi:uncharacterized membrane protein YcaP (DUF421 family)